MAYKLKNLRILVIDDNTPVRMLIRTLLLDLGFGVVDVAPNVQAGWELYRSYKPDVILVDWRLDDSEGLEFVRRVRKDRSSPTPHLPMIVMTGYTNKQRVFEARDTGVTEFLIKPFSIQALTEHLTHIIEKPRDFVMAPGFTGPDRRRRRDTVPDDGKKRKVDKSTPAKPKKTTVKTELQQNANYLDLRGNVYNPSDKN